MSKKATQAALFRESLGQAMGAMNRARMASRGEPDPATMRLECRQAISNIEAALARVDAGTYRWEQTRKTEDGGRHG